MAEKLTTGGEDEVITGLARLGGDNLAPPSSRFSKRRKVLSVGLGLMLVSGVRVASYSELDKAAFALPPGCELTVDEVETTIEAELAQDKQLRVERADDETVLSRLADSVHQLQGSAVAGTIEYMMLADNHELRQHVELSGSEININLFSNENIRVDGELLEELWRDTLDPQHFPAGLSRSKFVCHDDNFFESQVHSGKTLNIRLSVTGDKETPNYGFVSRSARSQDVVDARFVVSDVDDLNIPGFIAHEVGVHATEWFDRTPMLPRVRALENVANEVADDIENRWGGRDFELFQLAEQ